MENTETAIRSVKSVGQGTGHVIEIVTATGIADAGEKNSIENFASVLALFVVVAFQLLQTAIKHSRCLTDLTGSGVAARTEAVERTVIGAAARTATGTATIQIVEKRHHLLIIIMFLKVACRLLQQWPLPI